MSIETSLPAADVELERYQSYRAVSPLAVASLALGLLSPLAFLEWVFGMVPLVGLLLGLLAVRQVRLRRRELTGLPLALGGVILSAVMLPAGWGWLYYVYRTEVPEGYTRIHYDLFRPTEEDPTLPPQAAFALDNQKVFLKGYMMPPDRTSEGLREFILCRDNGDCCFGGQPKVYDMVQVTMPPNAKAAYNTYPRKVVGTFRIYLDERPIHQAGGTHFPIYHIEADYLP